MNKIRNLLLLLICILGSGCKPHTTANNNDSIDENVFNFIVIKIIPQFIKEPYDICGTFNSELPDSLIASSLKSVFNEKNIEYIINQYSISKNQSIESFIHQDLFVKRTGSYYYDTDSITTHFILSAPLYNIAKDTCVIFSLAMPVSFQGSSTRDGFYFLVCVTKDTLKYLGVVKNEYTTFIPEEEWEHHHECTFVLK